MSRLLTFVLCLSVCCGIAYSAQCYLCQSLDRNCNEGRCYGTNCFKIVEDRAGRMQVTKGCRSGDAFRAAACINPMMVGGAAFAPGAFYNTGGNVDCSCNTDWCNSATKYSGVPFGLMLILAVTAIFRGWMK